MADAKCRFRVRGPILTLALITVSCSAVAQEDAGSSQSSTDPSSTEATALTEVIVTAQKRAEPLQRVPMAITALTQDALIADGVTNFRDYAVEIPNLAFAYSGNLAAQGQTIAIRGIYGRGTTGLYVDDTPVPGSLDPRVLDIERIEALKGPQGTLYGARSEGGTVRLITVQPDPSAASGYVHASTSCTKHGSANGAMDAAVNIPLVADKLAARINGYYEDRSGVFDRVFSPDAAAVGVAPFPSHEGVDRTHFSGGSLSLLANLLDDRLTILPRVMVARTRTTGCGYADVDPDNLAQSRWFDVPEKGGDAYELYSLTTKLEVNVGEITSSTSYFDRRAHDQEDDSEAGYLMVGQFFGIPPVPVVFHVSSNNHTFSQELRFASAFASPLQLTTGVFYQDTRLHGLAPPTSIGPIANVYSAEDRTRIKEIAAFGEATLQLTDKFSVIAGGRWFDNKVFLQLESEGFATGSFTADGVQRQRGFNPKLGVQYQVTPDIMSYATAAKGFRIGGINAYSQDLCAGDIAAMGLTAEEAGTFKSDAVWSYELGAKTNWADHRVRVNAAIFDIEWEDVQQMTALQCGFQIVLNGGAARSRGGELEIQTSLTPALALNLGAGYTDAHITDSGPFGVIPAGSRVQQVPKWTVTAAIDYRHDAGALPFFVHLGSSHVGSSLSTNNSIANPRQRDAYTLVKLRTGFDVGRVEVTAFADNLFNEHANLSDAQPTGVELPGRPRIVTNRPRTIGIEARMNF